MNDEGLYAALNSSFVLNNQETLANDSFVSQNEEINVDSDNYTTEEEEEDSDEDDNVDAPPFSPVSCASSDPVEEHCQVQEAISEENEENTDTISEDNSTQSEWNGFTIVIDNLDKNIRRSFQRIDFQTRSLHICNAYAVKDRVNFSTLSDEPGNNFIVDLEQLLPNTHDLSSLIEDIQILITR